jgi:spore maturation protein CgeB
MPALPVMKIVIFGLTLSSSWGNGHATLWRALCRSLIKNGHQIVFFERNVPYYAEHRDLTSMPGLDLRLFGAWNDVVPVARQALDEADVGMVTSYCPDGIEATELVLMSRSRLKVFYDLDTPVTLDALNSGNPVAYIGPRGLADFDLVLSYTGGRALELLREQLGARRVAPLYGSVDPEQHHPVASDPQFACDLSYLGTYAADRQAALEMLFIEPARQSPTRRFLIGGAQYPQEFPWTENIFFARHVEPSRHPAFYSSSRATLNVTRRAMKDFGYCPSGRLFEAAACATAVVSDVWEGLDQFFVPDREIVLARNSQEVLKLLEQDPAALERIGEAARKRVLSEHTADHRARELEALLESVPGEDDIADTAVATQTAGDV